MGCGVSRPEVPPLVAQPSPAAAPLIAKATTADGELKLMFSQKKLDGFFGDYTHFFKTSAGEEIVRYKRSQGYAYVNDNATMPIYHNESLVALLKHGDQYSYRKGHGQAVLYGLQPPEGASGHATVVQEGVTLHALYEIRITTPEADLKRFSFKDGIGMYAAGANGTFAAAPSLVHKDGKWGEHFVENGRGECVAQCSWLSWVTVAANVDTTLIVVLYAVREEYWKALEDA